MPRHSRTNPKTTSPIEITDAGSPSDVASKVAPRRAGSAVVVAAASSDRRLPASRVE